MSVSPPGLTSSDDLERVQPHVVVT